MNNERADSANLSARFDRIEVLLNSYPDVTDEQLRELKRWFNKEASAFEIASLASKAPVGYGKFRADHIDKFSKGELLLISCVSCAILVFLFFSL